MATAYDAAAPIGDEVFAIGEYVDALRRRSKSAIVIGLVILVSGFTLTFLLPNTYKSTATVLIEQPEVPPGLVPTTVTTFAAQQLNYINQRVMTRSNLAAIIEKFDLYADKRKHLPTLLLVEDVQREMTIDVISVDAAGADGREVTQTIAFTLGFEHGSPKIAQKVANELVSLYLAENVRARTVQTAETSEFVEQEVDRLDAEVKAIEQQIAAFKRDNEGSLPQQIQLSMGLMERLESEIIEIQRQLDSIKSTRIQIEAQLVQVNPIAPSILPDGRTVVAPADQLKAAQTQLAVLEARYSDDHPDLQRLRREIQALEKQVGIDGRSLADLDVALTDARAELAKAREQYSDEHPEVQSLERTVDRLEQRLAEPQVPADLSGLEPDNPAYIQLSTQLKTLESEAKALITKRQVLQGRLADLEARMMRGSEVERELSGFSRKLSTATQQYLAARDKLFSAQLGQALEIQSKGERFTLVEPPDLPLRPDSPNRGVLLAMFTILALFAAFGWPQAASMIDGAVSGPKSLERIISAPPIAEIPEISNAEDQSRVRRLKIIVLLVIPLVIVVSIVLVHFLISPLDVLYYVLVRRFGF